MRPILRKLAILYPFLLACGGAAAPNGGPEVSDITAGTPTVEIYAAPPNATASPTFSITADSQPIFTERFRELSYARFGMKDPVTLTVRASQPVTSVRTVPESLAARITTKGNTFQLPIDAPGPVVVFVNTLEKLLIFPDPIDPARPKAGDPGVINVLDRGANKQGTLTTVPLQTAIDEASALPGGGTVLVPPGLYTTGTLRLKSHVTLYLMPGAILKGSRIPANYPVDPGRKENGTDTTITDGDARFAGEFMTFSRLLMIGEATDVHIRGQGTIDGDGSFLRKERNAVPNLLRVRSSSRVTINDVMLRDSAAWTVHLLDSDGVDISNIKILNDRTNLNTDGIDPDSSRNVTIDKVFIYTKDDGVCLKATNNSNLLHDVENITVTNSIVSSMDAALKLGTESQAAVFRNVRFENNDVFDSDRAMSVVVRDGAAFRDITYKNIRIGVGVNHFVEQVIGVRAGGKKLLGTIDNLTFDTIDAPHLPFPRSNWTWYAQFRPTNPKEGDTRVAAFEGADGAHGPHAAKCHRAGHQADRCANGPEAREPVDRDVRERCVVPVKVSFQ